MTDVKDLFRTPGDVDSSASTGATYGLSLAPG